MKYPSPAKLRPELPAKRLPGEKHAFKPKKPLNLIPPIHTMRAQGPEQTYQASVEAQLRSILEKYGVFDSMDEPWLSSDEDALIAELLHWRRA